ncbi:MAG: plasma-membrane proton-efflux P-type ATPase [Anaerolineae bacterium]
MITHLNKTSYQGLTHTEAQRRLQEYGANQISDEPRHPVMAFLSKFWGPIPWMLEATLVLQFALGKTVDAFIIAIVLMVNAIISYAFERKAQGSLALLQEQLRIQTRVLRDSDWQMIPAQELVPGDVVRLRVGDLVPADVRLLDGAIAVDQSSLTGETNLVELGMDGTAYAASVIRRGEAVAEISATGIHTSYSKTAKLIQTASSTDHGDVFVQKIVMYLIGFTLLLVIGVLADALAVHLVLSDILLFILALLIAAIPVSLPVTFTLATAVGARKLASSNVLASRLAAVKEAAGMDVLCTDKTGTITQNELSVVATHTYGGYSKSKLLRLAALASDEANQDPIDMAILNAANAAKPRYRKARRLEFTPFDPATKRTEAMIHRKSKSKRRVRVIKGAPHIISRLTHNDIDLTSVVEQLSAAGNRCIAIATGKKGSPLKTAGLLALQDSPRDDAAAVVRGLHELGVRVIMITGDDLPTARSIADHVGITGPACTPEVLQADIASAAANFDVFARVYPEDKYRLVQALQAAGHIVAMTGDGVNDAPAIRQAEIGIAMNNATDITKSAASLILTAPGLKDILSVIEVGRSIFQRITTYTLNKIIKTFHLGLFLTLGLILTGTLIARPLHILLMVLANDLVSMSLTTDQVTPSPKPNQWRITPLIGCGLALALGWLVFSFGVFFVGRDILLLDPDHMDTLMFLMLVFVAGSNVYLIRERRFFWRSRPGKWLVLATVVDLVIVTLLAVKGILMAALNPLFILELLGATIGFMVVLDILKTWLFRRFGIQQTNPRTETIQTALAA